MASMNDGLLKSQREDQSILRSEQGFKSDTNRDRETDRETDRARETDSEFPQPLSASWRTVHNLCYLTGGLCFFFGSMCYFPPLSYWVAGGWLFTVGSAGFFCADALEWWTNNRVGCCLDRQFRRSFEKAQGPFFAEQSSLLGKWQRAENGVNFFTSLCGSTLYLLGSIYYIPSLDALTLGSELFIVGSAFIFFAQGWKIYRAGCNHEDAPTNKSFAFANWKHDLPGVIVDITAGLGGVAYFIGSFMFLPQYDTDDGVTWTGASWFQVGGTMFLLSGIVMFYRYFFTLNYPH